MFLLLRVTAIALLFHFPLYAQEGERFFVRNLEDFRTHTQAHIQRVRLLGLKIFDENSQAFPGLERKLLNEFLSLHDQSKINQTPEFRRAHDLQSSPTFLERLYQTYGQDFSRLSPDRKREAASLVEHLNQIDDRVAEEFFRARGIDTKSAAGQALAERYRRIEKIADLVDRGLSPVSPEEFHKPMDLASRFLKSSEDKKIAVQLEKSYQEITRGYGYLDFREHNDRKNNCEREFRLLSSDLLQSSN